MFTVSFEYAFLQSSLKKIQGGATSVEYSNLEMMQKVQKLKILSKLETRSLPLMEEAR